MSRKPALYLGGIESSGDDPLNALARALVEDAKQLDQLQPGAVEPHGRHVNTAELEQICKLVLEKLA